MPNFMDLDQPNLWAEHYNAEHTRSDNPDKTLLDKRSQYRRMQNLPVLPSTAKAIKGAVDSGAFSNEMKVVGATPDQIVEALNAVSRVETAGGAYNEISPTGAAGILQVTDGTFRDLLKRGVVGPKALKALGRTKKELLGMSNKERQEYLKANNDAAAMFGLGAYMNKLNKLK